MLPARPSALRATGIATPSLPARSALRTSTSNRCKSTKFHNNVLHTRPAEIAHADVSEHDGDRTLLLTLIFTDNSEKSVTYKFQQSVHGNEILVKLLKGAGYDEEKRLDRLFADLIGARIRARLGEEGELCGVGHRLKNNFYMWDDQPAYPVEDTHE